MTSVAYLAAPRALDRARAARGAGPSGIGERVRAYDPVRNGDIEVEICSPVFVDPKEEKLRV